jgi:hypothetical protein
VRLAVLGVAFVLVLSACGGSRGSASDVVRAWSDALGAYDNERAGSLFAPNAAVVQGDQLLRLHTHQQAVAWNARLPCASTTVSLVENGNAVEATFRLREGTKRPCRDPAGAEATVIFVVEHGRIILFDQIGSQIALGH